MKDDMREAVAKAIYEADPDSGYNANDPHTFWRAPDSYWKHSVWNNWLRIADAAIKCDVAPRGDAEGGRTVKNSVIVTMKWRPIQEHVFPWEPHELIVACFYVGPDSELVPEVAVFEAICSKGDYSQRSAGRRMGMTTLLEEGWTPFAWLDAAPPPIPTDDEMHRATEHFRGRLGSALTPLAGVQREA